LDVEPTHRRTQPPLKIEVAETIQKNLFSNPINPVRNSSAALNAAGIILKSKRVAASGPEGAAGHHF
jgi:hypothetical protein